MPTSGISASSVSSSMLRPADAPQRICGHRMCPGPDPQDAARPARRAQRTSRPVAGTASPAGHRLAVPVSGIKSPVGMITCHIDCGPVEDAGASHDSETQHESRISARWRHGDGGPPNTRTACPCRRTTECDAATRRSQPPGSPAAELPLAELLGALPAGRHWPSRRRSPTWRKERSASNRLADAALTELLVKANQANDQADAR